MLPQKYKHQQKIGDLIYTLPVLKDFVDTDGHPPCELYLAPKETHGHTVDACRSLLSLLESQYYISKAELWNPTIKVDRDLKKVWWMNKTRTEYRKKKIEARGRRYGDYCEQPGEDCECGFWDVMNDRLMNLCYNIIHDFGKPLTIADKPWLSVEPKRLAPIIISRSSRYKNPKFPWKTIYRLYKNKAIFVGLPSEHRSFCERVGEEVPFYPTTTFLELAQIIAGCDLFIGNQSAPYSLAEAMKKKTIQETSPRIPSILFNRPNVRYYMRRWFPACVCGDIQCSGQCRKLKVLW